MVSKKISITINSNLLAQLKKIRKHNGTGVSTFLQMSALEKIRREGFK